MSKIAQDFSHFDKTDEIYRPKIKLSLSWRFKIQH